MNPTIKTFKLCNCNASVAIDGEALARALKQTAPLSVSSALCRHELARFQAALKEGEDIVVACTQEAPLFAELAEAADFAGNLRFVNIREQAGWSVQGASATPKMAALLAMASGAEAAPVPAVSFASQGALLIVGPAEAALYWAEALKGQLDVTVLLTAARHGELPSQRDYPVYSGASVRLDGYLGAFSATWQQHNPIDLQRCTRCNACVRACPEGAIGATLQIDLEKCRDHRDCVTACGAIGAIDFARGDVERAGVGRFDLVLDLCADPTLRTPQPPMGYRAPGRDALDQATAVRELVALVGEFEQPRYAQIAPALCAHSRNAVTGCTRCLDVCSTAAITSAGDFARIDPHLCQGCGGCATVCPTGAVRYAYPAPSHLAERMRTALAAYRAAGGEAACLLLHDGKTGREQLMRLGRLGKGLPARVIPLELHDVAAGGLDVLLAALAYGANQCVVLAASDMTDSYAEALRKQMAYGETLLGALGYAGAHFSLIQTDESEALESALWALAPAAGVAKAAVYAAPTEKRRALEFAIDHLAEQAPQPLPKAGLPLPAGAPFGGLKLDTQKCTLCLACAGACPTSALMDTPDTPRLRFLERNCVQCGLCVNTCPEGALALLPRLLPGTEARREQVLNEAAPFACVRCGTPFATRQMIDAMLAKLSGHAMFADSDALARLQMCADCRVKDMLQNKSRDPTISDL